MAMAGTGRRHSSLPVSNATGFQGVSYNRQLKKYEASCTIRGKKIYLDVWDDVLDAGIAACDYRLAHAEEIAEAKREANAKRSESIRRLRALQTPEERSDQTRRARRTTRERKERLAA